MEKPLRIGYVTAMWQRPELTNIIFGYVAQLRERLRPQIELIPVVSGSEGEQSRTLAEKHGFLYTEVSNSPLGAKWNASLALLKDQNIDGVCIFGSDDLVNETYFSCLRRTLGEGHDLIGVDGMYFYDQLTGRMFDWKGYNPPREKDTPGAGRYIAKRYIEKLGWELWPSELEYSLDGGMVRRLQSFFSPDLHFFQLHHNKEKIAIADVKTKTIMSSIEGLVAAGPTDIVGKPYEFFKEYFSESLAEAIFPPTTPRFQERTRTVAASSSRFNAPIQSSSEEPCIYCIDPFPTPDAPTHDALAVFEKEGYAVRRMSAFALLQTSLRHNDILYVSPPESQGYAFFSLLCSFYRHNRIIADCRGAASDVLNAYFTDLPIALMGAHPYVKPRKAFSIPHPMMPVEDPLPYEQRGNVVIEAQGEDQIELFTTAYINSNLLQKHLRIFFLAHDGLAGHKQYQHMGIYFFRERCLYDARQMFLASIFHNPGYATELLITLAGGTPAIFIGRPPLNLGSEQGVFAVRTKEEACELLRHLTSTPTFWKRASQAALAYAKEQHTRFQKALHEFIKNSFMV